MKSAKKRAFEPLPFSSKKVVQIFKGLKLTTKKLQDWAENNYFLPSHFKVRGKIIKAEEYQPPSGSPGQRKPKSHPRYYSFEKLIELQIFLRLREKGISPHRIKKAFDNFLEKFPENRLTEAKIFAHNKKAYSLLDRQWMLDLFDGKQVVSVDILLDESEKQELIGRIKARVEEFEQTAAFESLPNAEAL